MEKMLLVFVILAVFHLGSGAPRHHRSHKKNASATSRSYIDIDASDPFKVPKSSQYIDQPVPEFVHRATDKGDPGMGDVEDEENEPPPKAFDNIQDDLKHLGLDNVGNSGDESRFKNNADTPEDNSHDDPPPAAVDQENGANEQSKPAETEDPSQVMKGNQGESAQSRQFVPHDEESYDDDEKKK